MCAPVKGFQELSMVSTSSFRRWDLTYVTIHRILPSSSITVAFVALAEAAAKTKVRHFVLVPRWVRPIVIIRLTECTPYFDLEAKGENALRASGVPYTIVRPGGLTEAVGASFADDDAR